jgi:sugar lactone lactonase YvrE
MILKTSFAGALGRMTALGLLWALAPGAWAQSFSVSTLAGLPDSGSADGAGLAARFYLPTSLAVDGAGNVFVADTENDTIRRISPLGAVTTLAGSPQSPGAADGTGSQALFSKPYGVAVDALGNVFVADTYNQTVRQIFPAGGAATIAGVAGTAGFRNGPAAPGAPAAALFNYPYGITVDVNENVYVADALNNRIRKIANGCVTTLAGGGGSGSLDGAGANAQFSVPVALAADASGNVYVADYGNELIRRVSPQGVVRTLAGLAGTSGAANGVNNNATFFQPTGVAVDGATNVYVADTGNHLIRKITPDAAGVNWTVSTLAGAAGVFGDVDGMGSGARFYLPQGVAVDGLGNVYVGDSLNRTIRKITPAGFVTTLAGPDGSYGSADGPALNARFNEPYAVAVDGASNIFVADTFNHTIREISAAGTVTTLAGLAGVSGSSNGTNGAARFNQPTGVALDAADDLYVADFENSIVRKITPGAGTNWVVSTLAGVAGVASFANGPAAGALFNHPFAVAVDGASNVFLTDYGNQVVRLITAAGQVSTCAGSPGAAGYRDAAGTNALFDNPAGLALDGLGNVYVADSGNDVVRKIAPGGATTTLAGMGGVPGASNGTPGLLNAPQGVAVDGGGNVFVSDTANNILRRIASGGGLTTLAATAGFAGSADGPGPAAQFDSPIGIALDASGAVYMADLYNNVIRKAVSNYGQPLVLAPPPNQSAAAGSSVVFACVTSGTAPLSYQWLFDGSNISGATDAALSLTNLQAAAAGTYQLYLSNSLGQALGAATVLSVTAPPVIAANPGALSALAGSDVTLSVIAFGAAPLSYQWSLNATPLNGATASALSITGVAAASAGSYQVMVSNAFGSATSLAGVLQLLAPPQILTQPASRHSFPGAGVTLSVAAAGTTPLIFQWLKNGTNLIDSGDVAGSSSPALAVWPLSAGDAGAYSVAVTNTQGAVTSSVAVLAVGAAGGPLAVSGFNQDVVVPNTATGGNTSYYAESFDGTFAFYESNLDAISYTGGNGHTLGLPVSRTFASLTDGATVFQFAPYTANNVLYLTAAAPSGLLSLSSPAAYDSLSILAASANGGGNGSLVIQFSDGTSSPPLAFLADDWYVIAAGALTHFGRIYCGYYNAFYTDDYSGAAPNLYETTVDLDALGLNARPVAAVTFTMPDGVGTTTNTRTGVFALSGTASVALQSPQAAGGSICFSIQTLANAGYTVEQSTDLSSGAWQVYQHVSGNGQPVQITAPLTNRQQFFRVTQP